MIIFISYYIHYKKRRSRIWIWDKHPDYKRSQRRRGRSVSKMGEKNNGTEVVGKKKDLLKRRSNQLESRKKNDNAFGTEEEEG